MGIPVWALMTMIGTSAAGGMMKGFSQSKQTEDMLKQRNKEFIEGIAIKNRELKQQSNQFRELQKLREKQQTQSGPGKLMEAMSMITALGKQPSSTADTLKYLAT